MNGKKILLKNILNIVLMDHGYGGLTTVKLFMY